MPRPCLAYPRLLNGATQKRLPLIVGAGQRKGRAGGGGGHRRGADVTGSDPLSDRPGVISCVLSPSS